MILPYNIGEPYLVLHSNPPSPPLPSPRFSVILLRSFQPENVLLDKEGEVKLTGFALAGLFDPSIGGHVANLLHATCGTADYAAPEVKSRTI